MSSLIDMIQDMRTKQEKVEDALEIHGAFIMVICRSLDSVGMPRDNTVEMTELHGDPEGCFHENTFCRDATEDWFFEYSEGGMSKEQLIHNVVNWKEIYSKLAGEN